jgi:hypothetical protein
MCLFSSCQMRTSMAKLRGAFLQLLKTITLKTLACWRTDMTSTLCIHLATHFVRMLSCFIIFMLPFSAAALAPERLTVVSAMGNHRSVLESYRSAILSVEVLPPPITYSTSSSTATLGRGLEREIKFFVVFYVSLVLMFICCWHRSIFLHKRQLYLHHCWIAIQVSCQTNLE